MAWIESHQELRDHPKTYRLMAALQISKRDAIGLLQLLWWWCVDNATEGHILQPDEAVKRATEWESDAQQLVAGLVESGWLEVREEGGWTVHDWLTYCGSLVEKRLERRAYKDRRSGKKRETNGRRSGTVRLPTVSVSQSVSVTAVKTKTPPLGFADFWKVYPKKTAKNDAERAWAKLKPDEESVRWILSSLRKFKDSPEWWEKGGKFVPYPASWLNSRRWEDFPAPPPVAVIPATDWSKVPAPAPLSEERKRELDAAMGTP